MRTVLIGSLLLSLTAHAALPGPMQTFADNGLDLKPCFATRDTIDEKQACVKFTVRRINQCLQAVERYSRATTPKAKNNALLDFNEAGCSSTPIAPEPPPPEPNESV